MKILIGIVVVIVAFLAIVALQPSNFHIERSTAISAAPADIFPHLNDLKKMNDWSPWTKLDPAAKFTYEGPASGNGAAVAWAGNNQVGEGRQTIIESRAGELVRTRLDFKKPFESSCNAELKLKPQGAQTVVTWSMSGENNFFSKAFCLFMSQDKMIGQPFEQGLANLKTVVEAARK
jgi:hypothetical protein